ncbi:hypothetical protein [Mongoliitalea daihaiensis]|uniref:hypothetical protein n=1 Tax=Mongoliitalea daihaiensis TaxID=2782006 RepID=UPI001F20A2A2|nr:hypothetical protein [Mongoliitalea daihaiensis]UJP64017.1 hypothetical protein IPZ59_14475 [Mongoliitalea daihaiensis]
MKLIAFTGALMVLVAAIGSIYFSLVPMLFDISKRDAGDHVIYGLLITLTLFMISLPIGEEMEARAERKERENA